LFASPALALATLFGLGLCLGFTHANPLPNVASGRIERLADFPSQHVPARHVDVWLPDGYPAQAPYAVAYFHDGQMLFDAATTWNRQEWRVDEVAGELMAAGRTRPFIVVGVWNAGPDRGAEYFPQQAFEDLDAATREQLLRPMPGRFEPLLSQPPRSDRYLAFLVEELKPAIEARYATSPAREDTVLLGSSMGGLISMYALLRHPQVFGGAGCLSTHWPGSNPVPESPLPEALHDLVERHFPAAGTHRIYFDTGTITLDAWYPPLQARIDALMQAKGYREGVDWVSHVYPAAEHSEVAWAWRLHVPLQFLLPPR
jgi:enterochelin esterase-like enzyme